MNESHRILPSILSVSEDPREQLIILMLEARLDPCFLKELQKIRDVPCSVAKMMLGLVSSQYRFDAKRRAEGVNSG
jgi:hypothetical protein